MNFSIDIYGPTALAPSPQIAEATGPGGPWSQILVSTPGYLLKTLLPCMQNAPGVLKGGVQGDTNWCCPPVDALRTFRNCSGAT